MGTVYRATDTGLGREVAVKLLQARFAPGSAVARRFADEARIAAQLQHPGIPPVHDFGLFPDGRPYLVMKLIKGDTLNDLLKARPDPCTDRARLVASFEKVCEAVGYAHAHAVIHRDLNPKNVMVGAFGEVQVMDWGLAKVLTAFRREAEPSDPDATSANTAIRTDHDNGFTQAGSILGTPAYMAPEQAIGAIDQLDARTDVFGLGGMLAAILTGRPPFVSETAESTRQLAARGELDECFAHLDASGAEPELVTLCKRCLAADKPDRPADAREVAKAVATLRAAADDRARQAEVDRARAESQAIEQRKRRRVQLELAASVGLLLLASGGFAWWQDRQAATERQRRERNAEAVTGLLDQAEAALRAGDAARATVPLDAAEKRSAEGGEGGVGERMAQLNADLAILRGLDAVDRFRWTPSDGNLPTSKAVATRFQDALRAAAADPTEVDPAEVAARLSQSTVRDRLVAALDWVLVVRHT